MEMRCVHPQDRFPGCEDVSTGESVCGLSLSIISQPHANLQLSQSDNLQRKVTADLPPETVGCHTSTIGDTFRPFTADCHHQTSAQCICFSRLRVLKWRSANNRWTLAPAAPVIKTPQYGDRGGGGDDSEESSRWKSPASPVPHAVFNSLSPHLRKLVVVTLSF